MIVGDTKKHQEGCRYPHNPIVKILTYFIQSYFQAHMCMWIYFYF